ncbi:hypothetical protein BN1723_006941 [Verticillium longisporum]|uniref:Uncharacterized protein n=1 Tax=Verticillium longisporum TaxID=100787 RepID=A0A0G4NIE3_VERLO|nr:hypothetical protein BN1723_006941 [Verticillium longisporum]
MEIYTAGSPAFPRRQATQPPSLSTPFCNATLAFCITAVWGDWYTLGGKEGSVKTAVPALFLIKTKTKQATDNQPASLASKPRRSTQEKRQQQRPAKLRGTHRQAPGRVQPPPSSSG